MAFERILAVDATGDALSVALSTGARVLRARRSGKTPHDETVLPAVESLLKKARLRWEDLDAVAVASGPGRFTGIRIGMSMASMLALRLEIPALALSRLEAAALKSGAADVVAALPGWKGETYRQRFKRGKGGLREAGEPAWTAPEKWAAEKAAAEKDGAVVFEGDVDAVDLIPLARERLARKRPPPFEPFYLKPAGYEKPRS